MDSQLRDLLLIYGITGLSILILVIYRHVRGRDIEFLQRCEIFSGCNLWCVSHFFMYVALGIYAPKYWIVSMVLSVLWEIFEYLARDKGIYISPNIRNDIITNSLGLLLGVVISNEHIIKLCLE